MRRIGLAALFLVACAFGALAADTGTQRTGKAPGAQRSMHHKTMYYGKTRRHGTAYYRHRHYRTGYYVGGRRYYRSYAYGTPGSYYYQGHRRIYGARYYGHRRTALYHGHRRTAMHHGHRMTAMHRGTMKGHRTAMTHKTMHHKASKNITKGSQNEPAATRKATKTKPSTY